MHKHGIAGSRTAWSFFERHNISFKKSLRAAEQDRPDVARARRCWKRRQAMLNSTRLVFIDETAANTKMVRLSGRCPRGERLVSSTSAMLSVTGCHCSSDLKYAMGRCQRDDGQAAADRCRQE